MNCAFCIQSPRLQNAVQPRFQAGSGPRRAIAFLLIGQLATVVSPSWFSEFIFAERFDRYDMLSLGYNGMGA